MTEKPNEHTALWNPRIMRVFSSLAASDSCFLFGITGDIDNLGFYVARNGRAAGENLVDHFNRLLQMYIEKWTEQHSHVLIDICYVPAGEEISVFGTVNDRTPVQHLFLNIKNDFHNLLQKHRHYLDFSGTSLTFGCSFLENADLLDRILRLAGRVHAEPECDAYPDYLEILTIIRRTLGFQLDVKKFESILEGNTDLAAALRLFVYMKLLQYKRSTQAELPELARILRSVPEGGSGALPLIDVGLSDDLEQTMNKLHSQLEERMQNAW